MRLHQTGRQTFLWMVVCELADSGNRSNIQSKSCKCLLGLHGETVGNFTTASSHSYCFRRESGFGGRFLVEIRAHITEVALGYEVWIDWVACGVQAPKQHVRGDYELVFM